MNNLDLKSIAEELIDTFLKAGKIAKEIGQKGAEVIIKADKSPVTNGDLTVDKILANPQSVELLTTNETKTYARSLGLTKDDLYSKPVEYTASSTFATYDYTAQGVDRDKVQVYKNAGYPQLSQVSYTAFNISDFLSLHALNLIKYLK